MSAGNHAQGLAYSGNKLNVNTNIVMPLGTPFTKIRRTKAFGGKVFLKGNDLVESKKYVNELMPNGSVVTRSIVIDYVNHLPLQILMHAVNYQYHKMNKDEKKMDLEKIPQEESTNMEVDA